MITGTRRIFSVFLAAAILLTALAVGMNVGTVKADAASWNGTTYGGGSVSGYRTFLEAFGIDYDTYMKWMDDHDADSPNPNYYIGTRYVGFDHRNPNGDCSGAYGSLDVPGQAALNCTGFVWHVLYKSAVNSGASRSQINMLPVMGNVTPTWANLGVYRIYFPTKEAALASGVLEKGDLLWMYGTKDNHNAIFYGDSPSHDRYWHSAGPNSYGRIDAPGDFLGMWVAKVTQPNKIELSMTMPSASSVSENFGAKFCIFTDKGVARDAANHPNDTSYWDGRIGTIVIGKNGTGKLLNASAPAMSELYKNGSPQTGLSYFNASAKKVDMKQTYYAVQWSAAPGREIDKTVFELKDTGKRTSTGYKIFGYKIPKKVAQPAFSSIVSTTKGVSLSWNRVSGADKYRVYYKNSKGDWTRMTETASTNYLDTDVKLGNTYTYTIRCVDSDGDFISSFNDSGWKYTHRLLDTPQIVSTSSAADGVHIKWNSVSGAERYRVYYLNSKGGWVRMAETGATEFTDDVVTAGNSYTYTVRCVDRDGDFTSDFNRNGWKYTYTGVETPQFTSVQSEGKGIRLQWNPVDGAARYRLYYRNSSGGWNRLGETAGTQFLDDEVTIGNSYTYTIRALNANGRLISLYNASGWKARYNGLDTPQIASLQSTPDGVKIIWNAVDGAEKYRVYYKNSKGGWTRLTETTALSVTDADVRNGSAYTYTVRVVSDYGTFLSGYNTEGSRILYRK